MKIDCLLDECVTSWDVDYEVYASDLLLVRGACPLLRDLPGLVTSSGIGLGQSTVTSDGNGYLDEAKRSSRSMSLGGAPPPFDRYEKVVRGIEGWLASKYHEVVNSHALVKRGSSYELLRYEEGQRFGEHVDVVIGSPDLSKRTLAIVALCGDDFEGGELVFPRQGLSFHPSHLETESSVRMRAGDVLVFPAVFPFPHEVTKVTRGVRWSVVGWLLP